jgi:hypothetical protein
MKEMIAQKIREELSKSYLNVGNLLFVDCKEFIHKEAVYRTASVIPFLNLTLEFVVYQRTSDSDWKRFVLIRELNLASHF